jgi:hypothetical protein
MRRLSRLQRTSVILVIGGVLLCCIAALANATSLGPWQVLIYIGAAIAGVGTYWFRRKLTLQEQEIERRSEEVFAEHARIAEEEHRLHETRRTIQRELAEQATRLDQREQTLATRFTSFHEWLEFPAPVDLAVPLTEALPADSELAELVRKDRRLNELLQEETKGLFEKILNNHYAASGALEIELVREDFYGLILKVARIYQPSIEQPLLETSLERVLRAAGRACLQFLVVLDELPISVKEYNLNSIYGYIRQGVKAYGAYKSVEPYWGYANTAYYLGRLALGASPLTLGAWWFVGTLGREGARLVTMRLVNRQGMALLQGFVRVIGYEVASMYGGDFRHRDANWIYGAELTELVARFPASRDSLKHALRDLAALQLRSEYDRVFLTRLVASGTSARPERYRAASFLTVEERRAIAQRLERFLESFIHGKSPERVEKWQAEVESRLDVKLSIAGQQVNLSRETQIVDALRSLVGFLTMVKQCDISEVGGHLDPTNLWKELTPLQKLQFLREQEEAPAYLFEQPDLDPEGDITPLYLDDLAWLSARVPPHDATIDDILRDVAIYLRQDAKSMTARIEKQHTSLLEERLADDAPQRKFPIEVVRAVLDLLAEEKALFIYGSVKIEPPPEEKPSLWLLGTPSRLVLLSVEPKPRAIWRSDAAVNVEIVKRFIGTEARISGGLWLSSEYTGSGIRVAGPMLGKPEPYFKPLSEWNPSTTTVLANRKAKESF